MKLNPVIIGTGLGLACLTYAGIAIAARGDTTQPNREFLVEMAYSHAGESQREYVDEQGQPLLRDGLVEQPVPPGTLYRNQRTFPFSPVSDEGMSGEADRAEREWTIPASLQYWEASGCEPVKFDESEWAKQGKQLYEWNCSACHGVKGDAKTVVNDRAVSPGASIKSLIDPNGNAMKRGDGWIYHAITHGTGVMASHADKVNPVDRWKVILYLRTLQGK
ncbi:MAG: cytochrome c [Planctomycetaceae bacterium]|nr:cytochrome c [Planctomycetaceae bacterium]